MVVQFPTAVEGLALFMAVGHCSTADAPRLCAGMSCLVINSIITTYTHHSVWIYGIIVIVSTVWV